MILKRHFSRTTLGRNNDFSHVIVGAGVVGLAIAARLSEKPSNRVMLLERHSQVGTETSARNSEVIHAGIYFPVDALRTKLCVEGKNMIYYASKKYNIELKRCGKWVVAQDEKQHQFLVNMYERAKQTGVPLNWLSIEKAKSIEPAVIARSAIIESPTTGIISAHSLMDFYEAQIQGNGGDISLETTVSNIEYLGSGRGYEISCNNSGSQEDFIISSDIVINSAGLSAPLISNMVLPEERHLKPYYAKGNYFAYTASTPKIGRLIYPCPADYTGLGTHLTIDLGGRMRFGPDIEWVNSPDDLQVNSKNLEKAKLEIAKYISVDLDSLVPDYSGIRPKIIPDGDKFQDFIIREEDGFPGFVNLLSIESPGLTSSMAIAKYVEEIL